MTTTSRRLSAKGKTSKPSNSSGREKGIKRPKDFGIAINGNPYKGQGIKGNAKNTYKRIWGKFYARNGIKKEM